MGTNANKEIYKLLIAAGLTREGACGLMGNMQAESGMKSDIAQRGMTKLSDAQYTAAADNGLIDFVNDTVGYGLCQWTYSTRKAKLLAFAKNRSVSVGDAEMQVQFCLKELQDYPDLLRLLRTSRDVDQCADRVCDTYERPQVNNYFARREFARDFYNQFYGEDPTDETAAPSPTDGGTRAAVLVLQMLMHYAGYWGGVTGAAEPAFFAAARQFLTDLEKETQK